MHLISTSVAILVSGLILKSVGVNAPLWFFYIVVDGLGYGVGFRSHSRSWQLGLESESDPVQFEDFYIVQCSHLVWSLNPSQNPAVHISQTSNMSL